MVAGPTALTAMDHTSKASLSAPRFRFLTSLTTSSFPFDQFGSLLFSFCFPFDFIFLLFSSFLFFFRWILLIIFFGLLSSPIGAKQFESVRGQQSLASSLLTKLVPVQWKSFSITFAEAPNSMRQP